MPSAPRLLIPQEKEKAVRHKVNRLTRRTSIAPGDMIMGLNSVLRGWMNYYCYATNPHRVFARITHHAFWRLVRYLNKRQKQRGASKALRKYYGTLNGRRTIVYTSPLTGKQVGLVRSIGRKSLYRMGYTNPAVDRQENPWAVYAAASGHSPWQRAETKVLQDNKCAECGAELAEVHHKSGLAKKTDRMVAGYTMQKVGLCYACHQRRTQQQRSTGQQ